MKAFGALGKIYSILGNSDTRSSAFCGSFGWDIYYGMMDSIGKLYICSSDKSRLIHSIKICREISSDGWV